MPQVLNYKNIKQIPAGAVYIGRAMPRYNLSQSKWANLYKIGGTYMLDGYLVRDITREESIRLYRIYLNSSKGEHLRESLHELKGKDVVCWCAPEACHGDVLLDLVNKEKQP